MVYVLPETTELGQVELRTGDLSRSLRFYHDLLGLEILEKGPHEAWLAPLQGSEPILRLLEIPGAPPQPRHRAGLYHVAFRVPSRVDLARILRRLLDARWPFQGFADHLVSEALYLPDPDGNGLEIYRDRPRDTWQRTSHGYAMATLPLDLEGLLDELQGGEGGPLSPGTVVGHVHLHVGDLEEATKFYENLGFEVTLRGFPGAMFLSAGGYHHHIGLNIWAGRNVLPAPKDAAGLESFTILLPTEDDLQALKDHLGLNQGDPFVVDPSGITVKFGTKGASGKDGVA
ncbi:MAG: VOC family protein [Clostridiales bacterium]|nr:VOC family protein [Clostridiales bacterium]